MNNANKKHNVGFTLIELLVVIAIIGVLSGIVLQSLKGARQRSWNATRLSDIDQINKSLELYFTKQNSGVGSFPSSEVPPTANTWDCIGLTTVGATCWAGVILAPSAAQNTAATNINLALNGNISKIPKDPMLSGVYGDYYAYSSSWTWTASPVPTPAPPTGAYLAWVVNDIGSKPCGRGLVYTPWSSSPGFKECVLYLGK